MRHRVYPWLPPPLPETELDDSSYSAHAGGEEGSGSPLEHEQQHDSEGEGDARTEEEDKQDGEAREVPEAQRKVSRIGFDRVVSLVFETDEQAAPPPPTGKGADEAVGGSTKTLLRGVGGSTLRRFVSQRVLRRRGGGSSMPTGKQAPGGQQQPQLAAEPTKSGQLTMAEDRAVGAVSSAIYWQYASQMGVGVVLLIAGEAGGRGGEGGTGGVRPPSSHLCWEGTPRLHPFPASPSTPLACPPSLARERLQLALPRARRSLCCPTTGWHCGPPRPQSSSRRPTGCGGMPSWQLVCCSSASCAGAWQGRGVRCCV